MGSNLNIIKREDKGGKKKRNKEIKEDEEEERWEVNGWKIKMSSKVFCQIVSDWNFLRCN